MGTTSNPNRSNQSSPPRYNFDSSTQAGINARYRPRETGTGYGSSSGYASSRRYADSSAPAYFRCG